MNELVFTNARVVAVDDEFDGSVAVRDGLITAVDEGRSHASGVIDCDGDYLVPGFVELHTDNLEKHFLPRPGVKWPSRAAVMAHDAQIAAAGITTVFDALALGDIFRDSSRVEGLEDMLGGLAAARDGEALRAEHRLHQRCELSYHRVLETFELVMDDPAVGLVSIMDHPPGQRQFVDIEKYRVYQTKKLGMTDAQFDAFVAEKQDVQRRFSVPNRAGILERAHARGFVLASHDDATAEHVKESAESGMTIAEFPTTLAAAQASHQTGLKVLMSGPNLVLGGSHSGNIAARDLAAKGLLDIVSSDYVPMSLPLAAFALAAAGIGIDLPGAIRLVSHNPAQAAALEDRGTIAAGLRADLARITCVDGLPVVRSVWRGGQRIV